MAKPIMAYSVKICLLFIFYKIDVFDYHQLVFDHSKKIKMTMTTRVSGKGYTSNDQFHDLNPIIQL